MARNFTQHSPLILATIFLSSTNSAKVTTGIDEQAQLPYWELNEPNLSLRIVQRLPDQTRAYFSGRGFNKLESDFIASHCFFQNIFRNTSTATKPHQLEYDLTQWQINYHQKTYSLLLRENWQNIWAQRDVKSAQKIAFEWSLLPTKQEYLAADYNWGMSSYPLPHGANFDLNVVWFIDGQKNQTTISNIQCAKDIELSPVEE